MGTVGKLSRSGQNAHSPKGGVSEDEEKHGAHHAPANCALAPALEYGDQSNKEEEHRQGGQTLNPHSVASTTSLPRALISRKDTGHVGR